MRDQFFVAVLAFTMLSAAAHASGGYGSIPIGGIGISERANISIYHEALTLSQDKVDVVYEFENHNDHPVSIDVSFELPRFNPAGSYFSDSGWPDTNSTNRVDFETKIDGIVINPEATTKAFLINDNKKFQDITDKLKSLNIPPDLKLTNSHSEYAKTLIENKLVYIDNAIGNGNGTHELEQNDVLIPSWDQQTTFLWRQLFPSDRKLAVEHSYKPVRGAQLISITEMQNTCLDKHAQAELFHFAAALERARLAEGDPIKRDNILINILGSMSEIEYNLMTDNSWQGVIDNFTINIVNDDPDIVVVSCFPGATRSGIGFKFNQKHLIPQTNVKMIYFYGINRPPNAVGAWPDHSTGTELLPESGSRLIGDDELVWHTSDFLLLARNEIFARRGRRFRDPVLRAWFESKPWYHAEFDEVSLSATEQANVSTILREEKHREVEAAAVTPERIAALIAAQTR